MNELKRSVPTQKWYLTWHHSFILGINAIRVLCFTLPRVTPSWLVAFSFFHWVPLISPRKAVVEIDNLMDLLRRFFEELHAVAGYPSSMKLARYSAPDCSMALYTVLRRPSSTRTGWDMPIRSCRDTRLFHTDDRSSWSPFLRWGTYNTQCSVWNIGRCWWMTISSLTCPPSQEDPPSAGCSGHRKAWRCRIRLRRTGQPPCGWQCSGRSRRSAGDASPVLHPVTQVEIQRTVLRTSTASGAGCC